MLGFCDIYIFPPFALRREPSVDAISCGRFLAPSSAPKVRFECAGRSSTNTSAPCWLPQHPLVRLEVASGPVQSAGIECAAIVGGGRPRQPPPFPFAESCTNRYDPRRCRPTTLDVSVLVGARAPQHGSVHGPQKTFRYLSVRGVPARPVHGPQKTFRHLSVRGRSSSDQCTAFPRCSGRGARCSCGSLSAPLVGTARPTRSVTGNRPRSLPA